MPSRKNLYTSYGATDFADPPIDVYCENLKRIILLSNNAYTEMSTERGITLTPIVANNIIVGPGAALDARSISIEPKKGSESEEKTKLNIENILIDIVINSGTQGTPQEQLKRCAADCTVIKRIIRKIFEEGHFEDFTLGWPADSNDGRYVAPTILSITLEQIPIAQSQQQSYGYSGGVRLGMKVQYNPLQ